MLAPDITLYLLRHGETEWNVQRRFQGSQHDSPLTAKGRDQARSVATILRKAFDTEAPPHFTSSPAPRARATMDIILERLGTAPTFTIEPRIQEIDLGEWSGLTRQQAQERFPDVYAARDRYRWDVPVPGGESYKMVAIRAEDWLRSLTRDTVAVSHGGFSRIARGLILGLDADSISTLDEPQDCVFRIRGGRIERLEPTGS